MLKLSVGFMPQNHLVMALKKGPCFGVKYPVLGHNAILPREEKQQCLGNKHPLFVALFPPTGRCTTATFELNKAAGNKAMTC